MRILIKNASIVDAVTDYSNCSDILLADGKVEKVGKELEAAADREIDASGLTVLPGFIDMHSHLREPGFEYKETVASGTRAAAKGGYTTICCMPNTKPVIDNTEALRGLLSMIHRDALIQVLPIAAVSMGQLSKDLTDMKALQDLGAVAFSDDGQPVSNNHLMLEALKMAKKFNGLIIDHCEDHGLVHGGVINEGEKSKELALPGISNLSEELPIARDIMLAEEVNHKLHIAHVSTRGAIELIKAAKQKGIEITCEVTPHHMALSDENISAGDTSCKVNPPLRSPQDVEAVVQALKNGIIDVIATDHAPHHESEKGTDFLKAANGISGIETAFAVSYTTLVKSGILTLQQLVSKMSLMPGILLGIERGRIAEGKAADLVLVDLQRKICIDKNSFESKGKNTPFHGKSYEGAVVYTISEGKIVYKEEKQ